MISCTLLSAQVKRTDFWENGDNDAIIDRMISTMSSWELAGQLFMISYPGKELDSTVMDWIKNNDLGGVKIFGRNAGELGQLAEVIAAMQKQALDSPLHIPLLVATDQEGGRVRHVKDKTLITPGNMALGADTAPIDAWQASYYINQELKVMGINMNFAPTVDLFLNDENDVIADRAFSSDSVLTAELACAWCGGSREAGVIPTAKHFPGHGRTDKDSHGTLPIINTSLKDLMDTDLVPYKYLIKDKVPAIMVGHIAYPAITGNKDPATLSSTFMKNILRDRLGFDGIIITDDMIMGGASNRISVSKACFRSVQSGADIILVSRDSDTFDAARNLIVAEMNHDPAFKKQVEKSVRRILKVKMEYIKPAGKAAAIPDPGTVRKFFPNRDAEEFFFQQACRSVTLLPGTSPDSLIRKGTDSSVLLVGTWRNFFQEGRSSFPGASSFVLDNSSFYKPENAMIQELAVKCRQYKKIIFALTSPADAIILKHLQPYSDRIYVISSNTPAYVEKAGWKPKGVAVYGKDIYSYRAAFAVLKGAFKPKGKYPITAGD
ncbi:MAG: glycoside hydrolase family 3 protein [Spirochaetia bacterium]|nr:glycoside hydrolase family 3 protein [Spirochaetia bacterium]